MISDLLLHVLGWRRPSETTIHRACFNNISGNPTTGRKMILVISHTTYWDFFLFLLYLNAYSHYAKSMYIVMKPQPFDTFGWFLRRYNCIPATRLEDSGDGFVDSMVNRFKSEDLYKIVIAPKGKTAKGPWRSGYYHIRQKLGCDIAVAGIDYERKYLYLGPVHRHEDIDDMSFSQLTSLLQEDMSEIVPLNMKQCEIPIVRPHDKNRVSLIDWTLAILVLMIVILLLYIIYRVSRKRRKL